MKIGLFFIVFILFSCGEKKTTTAIEKENNATKPPMQATEVKTAIAALKPFDYLIASNGRLKAAAEQSIVAQTDGTLQYFSLQNGFIVKENEVLAKLETAALDLKMESLKLKQFNAQADYESRLLGYETLLKDKTTDETEAIKKKLRIETNVLSTELERKELQLELQKYTIHAPFSGKIANVKTRKGLNIKAGQELCTIYSHQNLYAEVGILEADLPLLHKGLEATVSPIANPTQHYRAVLIDINPIIDNNGITFVKLQIKNDNELLLGMNVQAEIKIPQKRSIVVPKTAVVMRSGKSVVFSVENDLAKWNYVEIGRDNGSEIEIISGLKADATVITNNNLQLAHDAPVLKNNNIDGKMER